MLRHRVEESKKKKAAAKTMITGDSYPASEEAVLLAHVHRGVKKQLDTSPTAPPYEVKCVDPQTGVGAFASRTHRAGDLVLRETPWVFAQSYSTWNTSPAEMRGDADEATFINYPHEATAQSEAHKAIQQELVAMSRPPQWKSGHKAPTVSAGNVTREEFDSLLSGEDTATDERLQLVRCCLGCGAPLVEFLREECDRLDRVLQHLKCSGDEGPSATPPRNICEEDTGRTQTPPLSTWELICRLHAQHLARAPEEGSTDVSLPGHDAKMASNPPGTSRSSQPYVTEVDVIGRHHCVYFCTRECETHSLAEEGKRFVLTSVHSDPLFVSTQSIEEKEDRVSSNTPSLIDSPSPTPEALVFLLRYPTADSIVMFAQHPPSVAMRIVAWPTRLDVLSTIHSVARRCNERVWLLTLLLAKHLSRTLAWTSGQRLSTSQPKDFVAWLEKTIAQAFRNRLEDMLGSYAEGAMQLLSMEQRALLRFSWHLLTWWWLLCCAEEYTALSSAGVTVRSCRGSLMPPWDPCCATKEWVTEALAVVQSAAFPLQIYLQLYWMTNANVHMYIVVSPIYTLWSRWLQGNAECNSAATDTHAADSAMLFKRLQTLFYGTREEGEEAKVHGEARRSTDSAKSLHAVGVALYDVATKLNHSCVPNVCFQPTMGPVAASVVALGDIEVGEQLFTSYIVVDDFEEQACGATTRRQSYLQDHYGFLCHCTLCASAETAAKGDRGMRTQSRDRSSPPQRSR